MTLAALLAVSGVAQTAKKEPPWVAKDWTQWSSWDCENIQRYSPWAYYWDVGGREKGLSPYANADGIWNRAYYLVQLRSALPVRQAFLKQAQSIKRYDKMDASKKQIFDQEYSRDNAKYDGSQVVISWLSYGNSFPGQSRQGALVLGDGSLVMPLKTKLDCNQTLVEFGTRIEHSISVCAEYVFPRTVNGKPLYMENDKDFLFILGSMLPFHGKTEELGPQRLEDFRRVDRAPIGEFRFPISTLMYKGKLEY
ncbi:MAG: hypothetical protein WB997_07680 [Candidatus Acidiferrales bacterium]